MESEISGASGPARHLDATAIDAESMNLDDHFSPGYETMFPTPSDSLTSSESIITWNESLLLRNATPPDADVDLPAFFDLLRIPATSSAVASLVRSPSNLTSESPKRRRRSVKGSPVIPNNRYGRSGKGRCEQCRKWKQKVRSLPFLGVEFSVVTIVLARLATYA
jgi:hypothetical protein